MKPRLDVVMACGHLADNVTGDGEVYCSQCFGDSILAFKVESLPNVWRWAECMDCGSLMEAAPMSMPFYQHREGQETDLYACGCVPL